jgi:hypothetical protein
MEWLVVGEDGNSTTELCVTYLGLQKRMCRAATVKSLVDISSRCAYRTSSGLELVT